MQIRDGVSRVDDPSVAAIDGDMGNAGSIIRSDKEDKITGLYLTLGYPRTDVA